MQNRKAAQTEALDHQEEVLDLDAPIEVHLHNMGKEAFREQFMEDYFHCCLCGSELEFTHVAHFVTNVVKEDACCPGCKVRTRSTEYSLQ